MNPGWIRELAVVRKVVVVGRDRFGNVLGEPLMTLTGQLLNILRTRRRVRLGEWLGVHWQPMAIIYVLGTIPAVMFFLTLIVPSFLWHRKLLTSGSCDLQVPSWPRTLVVVRTVPSFNYDSVERECLFEACMQVCNAFR